MDTPTSPTRRTRVSDTAVCECGEPRDEHDAGIASCGMCPCQEYEPHTATDDTPAGWNPTPPPGGYTVEDF